MLKVILSSLCSCFLDPSSFQIAYTFILGEILSYQWLHYWYGVFSEHTYVNDNLYSSLKSNSSIKDEESSCENSDWYKLCPKHKHYNNFQNTKQNLLCNSKSGLEVIRNNVEHDEKHENTTNTIEFVYTRPKRVSSYKLLLDTSKVMGDNNRWQHIRRSLHRFIHSLPVGSVIR